MKRSPGAEPLRISASPGRKPGAGFIPLCASPFAPCAERPSSFHCMKSISREWISPLPGAMKRDKCGVADRLRSFHSSACQRTCNAGRRSCSATSSRLGLFLSSAIFEKQSSVAAVAFHAEEALPRANLEGPPQVARINAVGAVLAVPGGPWLAGQIRGPRRLAAGSAGRSWCSGAFHGG